MVHEHEPANSSDAKSKANIAFIVFLVITAFFLVFEHRAHITGWFRYFPYLLLLACPLMHLFMHRGHGHGEHGSSKASNDQTKREE